MTDNQNEKGMTKEEFEKCKKLIQSNELESDRFKKIKEFLNNYHKRENIKLETKLFKIVGTYGLDDNLINKSIDYKIAHKIKRLNKLKHFMSSLTEEQINSNLYLQATSVFMKTSIVDCEFIIRQLKEKIEDLELFDKNQRLGLSVNIPTGRLKLLPTTIDEQVEIPYYKTKYVNVLDDENIHMYSEYNTYARNIGKLATDIYHLQMIKLLSTYPEKIYNYQFYILNNNNNHVFKTTYYINKCSDNDVEKNKLYQLIKKRKYM